LRHDRDTARVHSRYTIAPKKATEVNTWPLGNAEGLPRGRGRATSHFTVHSVSAEPSMISGKRRARGSRRATSAAQVDTVRASSIHPSPRKVTIRMGDS